MAKCKGCGRTITDDRIYCYPCKEAHDCKIKRDIEVGGGVLAIGALAIYGIFKLIGALRD